jgi:hypothetical protein
MIAQMPTRHRPQTWPGAGQLNSSRSIPDEHGDKTFKSDQLAWYPDPGLVGGPFLVIGLSEVYKTAQTINAFTSARGTVVDNVWQAFAEGGAAYTPLIEFQTGDGQTVRFTDGIGTYPPEYEALKLMYCTIHRMYIMRASTLGSASGLVRR